MISNSVAIRNLYRDAGAYYVSIIIAELVQMNNHTEVALILARIYGNDEDVNRVCEIYRSNLKQGHISHSDQVFRDELVRRLIQSIEYADERDMMYNCL